MSKPNKDGWIRHRGGKCPVEKGVLVDVRYRCGEVNIGVTALMRSNEDGFKSGNHYYDLAIDWSHDGSRGDIMAWKLHKPEQVEPVTSSPAWNGESLPPVGIDIEVLHGTYGWIGARVVGYDGDAVIIRTNDGYAGVFEHERRPIRTPEQIAEEEREKAVKEMYSEWLEIGSVKDFCEHLYDSGYRKKS